MSGASGFRCLASSSSLAGGDGLYWRLVQHVNVETPVKAALEAGDERRAATLALRAYGSEVLSFVVVMVKDGDAAEDVFSMFCEDVWRGLPGFRWESSLRTWLYAVARRAALRHLQHGYEKRRRP